MANKIQVKRGLKASLPTLNTGEFGFCTDTKEVYIGNAEGNVLVTHPASHTPSIITQDANNRFVTDTEKTTWNGKAASSHSHGIGDITGLQTALNSLGALNQYTIFHGEDNWGFMVSQYGYHDVLKCTYDAQYIEVEYFYIIDTYKHRFKTFVPYTDDDYNSRCLRIQLPAIILSGSAMYLCSAYLSYDDPSQNNHYMELSDTYIRKIANGSTTMTLVTTVDVYLTKVTVLGNY